MDQLCTICGEYGHLRKKCTLCTMCYEPGHKAQQCSNTPKQLSPYQEKQKTQNKGKVPKSSAGPSSSAKSTIPASPSINQSSDPQATPSSPPNPQLKQHFEAPKMSPKESLASKPRPHGETVLPFHQSPTEERVALPRKNILKTDYYHPTKTNIDFNAASTRFNSKTMSDRDKLPPLDLKNPKDLHSDGRRPGFNGSEEVQKIRVLTNHFPVYPPEKIYKYVMKLPEVPKLKGRKELRRAWAAIIEVDRQGASISRVFPEGPLRWATDMDCLWSLVKLNLNEDVRIFNISIQREIGGMTDNFEVLMTRDLQSTLGYRDVFDLSDPHPGATEQRGQDRTELARALNALVARFIVARDDCANENNAYATQVGANRFFINGSFHVLDNKGRQPALWANDGYFMSIRPGRSEALLNMNTATTVFYAPLTVADLMSGLDLRSPSRMSQALKGKKAKICYQRSKSRLNQVENQIVRITGFGLDARSQSFMKGSEEISIEQYFKTDLHVHLSRPNLACVNVGNNDSDKAQWIPPECLQILPWQPAHHNIVSQFSDQIMKIACRLPAHNLNLIAAHGLRHMGLENEGNSTNDPQQFRISQALLELEALVLKPPKVTHKKENGQGNRMANMNATDRSWRTPKFLEAPPVPRSRINGQDRNKEFFDVVNLTVDNSNDDQLTDFSRTLAEAMQRTGMPFKSRTTEPRFDVKGQPAGSNTFARDIQRILERVSANTAFVVMVLPIRSIQQYQMIKTVADCVLGIPVFVCLRKNVHQNKNLSGYCGTFALKICTRMAGKTHGLDDRTDYGCKPVETLILGADVTHPQPGSPLGTPSIAAVVGNNDDSWMRWPGSLTIQESRKEVCFRRHNAQRDREFTDQPSQMISDIEYMAGQRMTAWQARHGAGARIRSIIYYRDGVSETQYDDVLKEEVQKIAKAHECIFKVASVAITVVLCVKRHNVRFYHDPKENQEPRKNLPAGTLVERTVTDPWRFDWFLQSHHAGIGTARSTHYVVVRNDMKMSPMQIQSLTNNLCYVWGRASKPVSLVPPAFYADILCERGRCYLYPWLYPEQSRVIEERAQKERPKKRREESEDAFKQRVLEFVGRYCWMHGDRGGRIKEFGSAHGPWRRELDGTMFYI